MLKNREDTDDKYPQNEFFFCYSINLYKFLKLGRGINYICVGLHEKSMQRFWLFKRDAELMLALTEYKQRGIEMGAIRL